MTGPTDICRSNLTNRSSRCHTFLGRFHLRRRFGKEKKQEPLACSEICRSDFPREVPLVSERLSVWHNGMHRSVLLTLRKAICMMIKYNLVPRVLSLLRKRTLGRRLFFDDLGSPGHESDSDNKNQRSSSA